MSAEVTLTDGEWEALAAAFAGSTRSPDHLVFLAAPAVERIVAARVEQARREFYSEALVDALHPEFGTEWREPDGVIWQAAQQARAEEGERIANTIEDELAASANYMTPSERKGARWAARVARRA